jgi:hypothetical protein
MQIQKILRWDEKLKSKIKIKIRQNKNIKTKP